MRIGILTLPLHTNYGGILQAYALQTVLERMGHQVVILDRVEETPHLPLYKRPYVYLKRLINKMLGQKDNIIFLEQYVTKMRPIIEQNTNKFINKYIHRFLFKNFSDISCEDFEALIVGSDQVWRPIYFGVNIIEEAFLRFAEGWKIKRIAYAASFGVDSWEYSPSQTKCCKNLINNFDSISVREDSGLALCCKYFQKQAKLVLDPTMLLNIECYIKLFKSANTPKSSGSLLCYILDDSLQKQEIIDKIAQDKKLIPFRVGSKVENIHSCITDRIQPPVEKWIRGFYDAKIVVTDSFHACVFSILFKKDFVVVGNKKRGLSRIESLLKMFGLEQRLVENPSQIVSLRPINYDDVFAILDFQKKISLNFLDKNLV